MFGEVRALEGTGIRTLPDVLIALGIKLEIEPPFFFKLRWKPRIIAPVRFHHDRVVWLPGSQEVIYGVALASGVPARPNLRSLGADGRAKERQASGAQGLRFFDPGN
jgi:hypothetical protein